MSGVPVSQTSGTTESAFRFGIEDIVIFPLVFLALIAKITFRALLSLLIHILDYAFPLAMQLVRFPLFTARMFGDGIAAILKAAIRLWPASPANRERWREFINQKWAWLRQKLSYRAFEQALHRIFENGMAWVFRRCRSLTPSTALLIITAAALWFPVSFIGATAIHAVLLAKAASLPAWMQLLHPLVTILAKSKLLVLPVYPAAWPQAKKHPLIQALARFYREFISLPVIQKIGYRYRQTERAVHQAVDAVGTAAAVIGLSHVLDASWRWLKRIAAPIGRASRATASRTVENLSNAWLIGPIVRDYAARYRSAERPRQEKPSERVRRFFEHWSIKFSASYYEAKEREEAAKAHPSPAGS